MKTELEINIDDYLSEEDKKDIAINVFKSEIRNVLFESSPGTVQRDSEIQRIIGNITHEVIFTEVQKYIPDVREQIQEGVEKVLKKKDLSYEVFRKKDAWDKEESLAITYMREEIQNNEEIFKERIRNAMAEYDLGDALNNELESKFSKLADTMYGLADLFANK